MQRTCLPVLGWLMACGSVATGQVIYVNDDADGANNGTSWQDAYTDLQDALAQAKAGDEIRVAMGAYTPAGPSGPRDATFSIPNGVVLQGGFSGWGGDLPHPEVFITALSGDLNGDDGPDFTNYGDNSYHVVTASGVGAGTEVRGVWIVHGNASQQDGVDQYGGGVLCLNSSLLVQGCTIRANQAFRSGGGMMASLFEASSVVTMIGCTIRDNRHTTLVGSAGGVAAGAGSSFTNCVFQDNSAPIAGTGGALMTGSATILNCQFIKNWGGENAGAIGGSGLTIANCEFIDNSAYYGGALRASGPCTILDSLFVDNNAGQGGCVDTYAGAVVTAVRCRFINNTSSWGAVLAGQGEFVNCEFLGNSIHPHGSGAGAAIAGSASAVNCLFSGNWTVDFGVLYGGPFQLTNCTLVGNETQLNPDDPSGAIHIHDSTGSEIRNCILWNNASGSNDQQQAQIYVQTGSVTVSNSIVEGWDGSLGGVGNSGADPLLIDADGPDNLYGTEDDNARLSEMSPARDEGNNAYLPQDDHDLDADGDVAEPIPVDLDDLPRVANQIVDLGAYEFQGPSCPADIALNDSIVDIDDLLMVISAWGTCSTSECPADIDNDGEANVNDLLLVINNWGACP